MVVDADVSEEVHYSESRPGKRSQTHRWRDWSVLDCLLCPLGCTLPLYERPPPPPADDDLNMEVDAEVSITVSELPLESPPAKRARTHRRRNWSMIDPLLCPLEDDDFARQALAALTEGATSKGEKIEVGFSVAEPPKASHIFYKIHFNQAGLCSSSSGYDSSLPWLQEARAVAADGDCILLCLCIVKNAVFKPACIREEFFVYRASPLTLTNLPRCGHEFINVDHRNNIGILCNNDGHFVVAHLIVTSDWDPAPCMTADLCCMFSKDGQWRTTKSVPIHNAEGHDHLIDWTTDTVITFDQRICWVDYVRGLLFCDVLSPFPYLCYVPLPVAPYLGYREREDTLSPYRRVCVTEDGLKFVDVTCNGSWFCDSHYRVPYAVSTWTMSMPNYEWVKDSCMEVEEFANLTAKHNLPCTKLWFPLVDRTNPELIYFALEDDALLYGKVQLLVVDMRTKVLDDVMHYTSGDFRSLKDDVYKGTASLNLVNYYPFLPCEFSEHLDQDEPHGRNKDVGGFIELPESSMLRPQKHGSTAP